MSGITSRLVQAHIPRAASPQPSIGGGPSLPVSNAQAPPSVDKELAPFEHDGTV